MTHEILRLDGRHSTACIETETGAVPVWRHFGARLQDGIPDLFAAFPAAALRRLPPASLDRLGGAPVFPCFGNGWPGAPALRAHRNGLGPVQELVLERVERPDRQSAVLHLADPVAALAARIFLELDPCCDVLTLRTELANLGPEPLSVDALAAASVAVPPGLQQVGYHTGQWSHEFQWRREPVPAAGWCRENRTGRTSHAAPPACFLLGPDTGEFAGEALGCQLAWSGNHRLALDRHDDGSLLLQAGEWLAPGEVILAPGATLATPAMHLAWSGRGLDGVSAGFHGFARRHLLRWPGGAMRPRPVHLNTWEAVYFDHDPETLRKLASAAAALGIERFVLDDGWFPARDHDRAGLGDWRPDPRKYPDGLGPLIAHVRALGMEFGLWVEPEMVNPDSDLFRAHPEWALQVAGRPLVLGRNQLVLDLARPEVAADLFAKLDALLGGHPIAYLKWDMNRDLAQACEASGRAAYRRQTLALYGLLDRLRERHPQVEIESCASGGGRADFGVLARTSRIWTSDNNDAAARVAIQSGALRLFPPEVLGAHVGPAPAHATGRTQGIDFRCAVACFGHMGVEADLLAMTPAERAALGGWLAFHKQWRPVLHGGGFHQGTTPSGLTWWLAQAEDRAVLAVLTSVPPGFPQEPALRLPPLADTGRWRVRLARQAGQPRARPEAGSPWLDALQGPGAAATGDELAAAGLPMPVMNAESVLLFTFEAVAPG